MRRHSDFALPVKADKVPSGPDWLHEIKQWSAEGIFVVSDAALKPWQRLFRRGERDPRGV